MREISRCNSYVAPDRESLAYPASRIKRRRTTDAGLQGRRWTALESHPTKESAINHAICCYGLATSLTWRKNTTPGIRRRTNASSIAPIPMLYMTALLWKRDDSTNRHSARAGHLPGGNGPNRMVHGVQTQLLATRAFRSRRGYGTESSISRSLLVHQTRPYQIDAAAANIYVQEHVRDVVFQQTFH